jgi:hypothetical protein
MPDPRLVSRAQRAATMLERAWERWRATQGLEAEAMPPVSSYVGYSIEEPWGRPRVVFGVNAEDAERLAALLQESAGYGPEDLPRPAMPDRGYDQSLFDDVRGRIPVQGWPPEFSDSREQLNSAGPSRPDEPELPLDLGPVPEEGPGRGHDLKPPVELGLSDEFRPADDFLDADEFEADDFRADDSQAGDSPVDDFRADGFRGDQRGQDGESPAFGLDAPYGVPYAGEAPYGAPYTGEPYYPDGGYGTAGAGGYGTAGADPAAGGYGSAGADPAAGGYGSAGADPAAGGYGTAGADPVGGGYGAAGPYRPADDLAGQREEAAGHSSDGAPGPGERPERDGQPGQPAGLLAGEAPWAGAQDATAATAEVREEAVPSEDASREVSGWKEDVPDEPGPDEDVRDESGDDEDVHAGEVRAGDVHAGDVRAGDVRGGDGRPGEETPGRNGPPGKHMLASGMPAGNDDPLDRDAQPDQAPRPHDGPVPGPRHGSAPDGPDWPPAGSARLATAGPGLEPPAVAQPAEDVPGGPTTSADRPADPAGRGSITDTMAAELAGWAAGELPGQAAARLASWAAAGGAVARGRQQTSIGGGTATERVS